jgi:hypothetical protein
MANRTRTFTNFLIIFVFFVKSLVRFDRTESINWALFNIFITRMHHFRLIWSSVRSNRIELFIKKKKSKIRVRFAVTNSYLIRFGSIRFDKRLTFDSFTVALSFQFDSEFIIIMHAWELCMGKITNPIAYFWIHFCWVLSLSNHDSNLKPKISFFEFSCILLIDTKYKDKIFLTQKKMAVIKI